MRRTSSSGTALDGTGDLQPALLTRTSTSPAASAAFDRRRSSTSSASVCATSRSSSVSRQGWEGHRRGLARQLDQLARPMPVEQPVIRTLLMTYGLPVRFPGLLRSATYAGRPRTSSPPRASGRSRRLDLVRAGVDLEDLGVPAELLHLELGHVAVAPEQLDGLERDLHGRLGRVELAGGGLGQVHALAVGHHLIWRNTSSRGSAGPPRSWPAMMSWNSMGLPNCTRSLAQWVQSSRHRSTMPRAMAAAPVRSVVNVFLAADRSGTSSVSPSSRQAPTRTSARKSCPVGDECSPILRSGGDCSRPGIRSPGTKLSTFRSSGGLLSSSLQDEHDGVGVGPVGDEGLRAVQEVLVLVAGRWTAWSRRRQSRSPAR